MDFPFSEATIQLSTHQRPRPQSFCVSVRVEERSTCTQPSLPKLDIWEWLKSQHLNWELWDLETHCGLRAAEMQPHLKIVTRNNKEYVSVCTTTDTYGLKKVCLS